MVITLCNLVAKISKRGHSENMKPWIYAQVYPIELCHTCLLRHFHQQQNAFPGGNDRHVRMFSMRSHHVMRCNRSQSRVFTQWVMLWSGIMSLAA